MHIKVKKITKTNAERVDSITGTGINFSSGYGAQFCWNIHFMGKDKNGLRCDVEIVLDDNEREKFIKDFEENVARYKKYIADNK